MLLPLLDPVPIDAESTGIDQLAYPLECIRVTQQQLLGNWPHLSIVGEDADGGPYRPRDDLPQEELKIILGNNNIGHACRPFLNGRSKG